MAVLVDGKLEPRSSPRMDEALSPIRKFFQHSTNSKSGSLSLQGRRQQQCRPMQIDLSHNEGPSEAGPSSPNLDGSLRQRQRLRKRWSILQRTTLTSSSTLEEETPDSPSLSISSPNSTMGTPISVGLVTPSSTPFATTASGRRRPRSALLGTGGRLLPFTVSTSQQNDMGDGPLQDSIETRGKLKSRLSLRRSRASSLMVVEAPPRPSTPAPLLVLDEETNMLGVSNWPGPHERQRVALDQRGVTDELSSGTNGLGLSAPFLPSFSDSSVTWPLHAGLDLVRRHPTRTSQESFHCRGLRTEEFDALSVGSRFAGTAMVKSASAEPSITLSNGMDTRDRIVYPTSPLSWRRRPWALSLQLKSCDMPFDTRTDTASPNTAIPTLRVTDEHQEDLAAQRIAEDERDGGISLLRSPGSRFSIDSRSSVIDPAEHGLLPDASIHTHLGPDNFDGRSHDKYASPLSVWSSSDNSCSTTLDTPVPPQLLESGDKVRSPLPSLEVLGRRRSNTTPILPPRGASMHTMNETSVVPVVCPASPPARVRLHLTLPPTAVTKYGSLPTSQTILMPTTASTLELKETICHSLRRKHDFSISPSQVGLFVPEVTPSSPSSSYTKDLTPSPRSLHKRFSLTSSPRLSDRLMESTSNSGMAKTWSNCTLATSRGSFRARLRDSQSYVQASHRATRPLSPRLGSPALRQLDNAGVLYQEGLQDGDAVIVRF